MTGDWSACKELHTLILAHTSVVKVTPLAGWPKLRILDLGGCQPLHDALEFCRCPALRHVNVGCTTNMKSSYHHRPTIANEEMAELARQCPEMNIYTEDLPGWEGWKLRSD